MSKDRSLSPELHTPAADIAVFDEGATLLASTLLTPTASRNPQHDEPVITDQSSNAWDHLPWWRRPSLYWLVFPFMLFTVAFGTTLVPKINLILVLICRDHAARMEGALGATEFTGRRLEDLPSVDSPQCRNPAVQAEVAKFSLWCSLLAGILSAFTSPILGTLSDRYGRTRAIALGVAGSFCSELLTIAAARMPDIVSVYWIMLGSVLEGLSGTFIAVMAISHAYATDITPPAERNVVFAFFHGCLFSGIAIGPVLGGYMTHWTDSLLTVFYFAAAACGLYMLSMACLIPEPVSLSRQLEARQQPYRLYAPLSVLRPAKSQSSTFARRNLLLLSVADTITFGVAMGSMTITILYSELRFGWGNLDSSRFLSAVNICRVLNLLIGLPILNRIFRGRRSGPTGAPSKSGPDSLDVGVIRFAFAIEFLGYLAYAFAPNGTLFLFAGCLTALGGIGSPTMQSSLTKHVSAEQTGLLLGASGLLHAVARVIAPTVSNLLYSATVDSHPQTIFLCFAAVFLLSNSLAWGVRSQVAASQHAYQAEVGDSHHDE